MIKKYLMKSGYIFDETHRLWLGSDTYCSENFESELANKLRNIHDYSVLSHEIRMLCQSTDDIYNLGEYRSAFLRPFCDVLTGNVLEIGAGTGVVSRFIGESGASLLALEEDVALANCAALRTSDLSNVSILVSNVYSLNVNIKFDVVVLSDIYENYKYFDNIDKLDKLLTHIKGFLADDGHIILSISNPLGINYIAGVSFFKHKAMSSFVGNVVRPSFEQLKGLLEKLGFQSRTLFFPFPNHIITTSVVSEEALHDSDFNVASLISKGISNDLCKPIIYNFPLESAVSSFYKQNILEKYVNSYIVIISLSKNKYLTDSYYAGYFTLGRKKNYCRETNFKKIDNHCISVQYNKLGENHELERSAILEYICPEQDEYIIGTSLMDKFVDLLSADDKTFTDLDQLMNSYVGIVDKFLIGEECKKKHEMNDVLPSNFFDLVPSNIIIDSNNEPRIIDNEWSFNGNLEFGYLIFRVCLTFFNYIHRFGKNFVEGDITREKFVSRVFQGMGLKISKEDALRFFSIESKVQLQVTGKNFSSASDFTVVLPADNLVEAYEKIFKLYETDKNLLMEQNMILEKENNQLSLEYKTVSLDYQAVKEQLENMDKEFTVFKKESEEKYLCSKQSLENTISSLNNERSRLSSMLVSKQNELNQIEESLLWKMAVKIYTLLNLLPDNLRKYLKKYLRKGCKLLYWFFTPWKLPARLRYLSSQYKGKFFFPPRGALRTIRNSGLFDTDFYIANYADSLFSYFFPLFHFLIIGWMRGRKPNKIFDPLFYYYNKQIFSLEHVEMNPLLHYILYGEKKGLNPSAKFDIDSYLKHHADVREQNISPLLHYLNNCGQNNENIDSIAADIKDKLNNLVPNMTISNERLSVFSENIRENYSEKISFKNVECPKVSIIIPVYNQFKYTYNCLKSISLLNEHSTFEIVIADDNSTDETSCINNYVMGIKIVKNVSERGFLNNCNNAIKYASGKYIYFLNNDTALFDGAIDSLVSTLESAKDIGCVGSKLIYSDCSLQEAGGIIWNDASGWNFGRNDNPLRTKYMYKKEVDYISGASLMIKKELLDKIGGFDTRYVPAYYEDTDLAFEVRKRGFKVVFQPRSIVMHFEGKSCGTDITTGIKSYQNVNKEKFKLKWQETLVEHFSNAENPFLAKDRSRGKKTILFIDHMFPTFDQDAGSRNIYNYIKWFVEHGYNVKFIPMNAFHMVKYADQFEEMGIECLYGNEFVADSWRSWFEENGKYLDYVYIHRSHVCEKFIDTVRTFTNAYVFLNVADLGHLRLKAKKEAGLSVSDEEITKLEALETKMINSVDACTSVSKEEVDYINQNFTKKAIWTPIFFYKKDELEKNVPCFSERNGVLFIGGFNHLPNFDAIKWFIEEIYPDFLSLVHSNVKLHVAGSNPPIELAKMANENIIIHGMVTDEELKSLYNTVRVIIIPLRYGGGLKGKTLEAIYNGVPFVGTKYAIQGFPEKENIFKSYDDVSSFKDRLLTLYNSEMVWNLEQKKYSSYLNKYFSDECASEILKKFYSF